VPAERRDKVNDKQFARMVGRLVADANRAGLCATGCGRSVPPETPATEVTVYGTTETFTARFCPVCSMLLLEDDKGASDDAK
jgi:hypothetical protein